MGWEGEESGDRQEEVCGVGGGRVGIDRRRCVVWEGGEWG